MSDDQDAIPYYPMRGDKPVIVGLVLRIRGHYGEPLIHITRPADCDNGSGSMETQRIRLFSRNGSNDTLP